MTRATNLSAPRSRRAFATFMVLWAIALVALVLVALQSSAFRQAAEGRETVARIRAYWAARAGVEAEIAALTLNTLTPDTGSALTVTTDMDNVARADLGSASYVIRHTDERGEVDGVEDAHAKLNVNTLDLEDLMLLDSMDESTAQSILNWIHGVDESSTLGADAGAYTGLKYPYDPREAPVRSLAELELVTGVDPQVVRGEDWNFNGRLDPAEDDANGSWPPDNSDGVLQAGWSKFLTAVSELGGMAASGQKRLDLKTATVDDIASRLKVDRSQAQIIYDHAGTDSADLADFVRTDLPDLATSTTGTLLNGQSQNAQNLTRDQLRTLLDEAIIGDPRQAAPRSGKININTVSQETLERFSRIDVAVADAIIAERQARSGGFTSLLDLLSVPAVTTEVLADLMAYFDVRSNVYVVTSRGRDKATGLEVEIQATLDRSSIPVVIRDLVVR